MNRAIAALDYHPDSVARSLKVRRTNTVGVIVPDVTNPFYPEIMRGMEDVARRSGYCVLFCDSNEDAELERSYLSMLFSRRVDGVLIAPANPYAIRDRLMRQRLPFVLYDRVPANFPGTAVITDNFEASRQAVRYLIALGHERIAIVITSAQLAAVVDRLEGFRQALKEAHLDVREDYFRGANIADLSPQKGYQCGLELMQLSDPPTAIFCTNNRMTLGVMRALAELHIPCPDRVSLLGFDDFEWALSASPRVTTVAQPTYEMGKRAMELLVQKMENDKDDLETPESQLITLPSELRIRDSTGPAPLNPMTEEGVTVAHGR